MFWKEAPFAKRMAGAAGFAVFALILWSCRGDNASTNRIIVGIVLHSAILHLGGLILSLLFRKWRLRSGLDALDKRSSRTAFILALFFPVLFMDRGMSVFSVGAIATANAAVHFILYIRYLQANVKTIGLRSGSDAGFAKALAAVAFLTILSITPWVQAILPADGDEPIYLLNAHSLAWDFDLDLVNNIENRDYESFYWEHEFDPKVFERPDLKQLGLAFLIAPGYLIGGRFGASAIIALFFAWLCVSAFKMSCRLTDNPQIALFCYLIPFAPPILFYGSHIFPEVPAAALIAAGLLSAGVVSDERNARLSIVCIVLLLWLKIRFAGAAAVLLVLFFISYRDRRRTLLTGFAGVMIGGIFLAALDHYAFNDALVIERFASVYSLRHMVAFDLQKARAFIGMALDQEFGLFIFAPVYIVALSGFLILLKKRPAPALAIGGVILGYVFMVVQFRGWIWYGGWNPPCRFVTAALGPAIPLIAAAIAKRKHSIGYYCSVLTAFSFFMGILHTILPGLTLNEAIGRTKWAMLLDDAVGLNLPQWLPSITRPNRITWFWIAALCVTVVFLFLCSRREERPQSAPSLFAPIRLTAFVCVLAFGVGAVACYTPPWRLEAEDPYWLQRTGGVPFPESRAARISGEATPEFSELICQILADETDDPSLMRATDKARNRVTEFLSHYHPGLSPCGWRFDENGSLAWTIKGRGVENHIRIRARRRQALRREPILAVCLDGEKMCEICVSNRRWREYAAPVSIPPGVHCLELRYENDSDIPLLLADMGVDIDRVEIVRGKAGVFPEPLSDKLEKPREFIHGRMTVQASEMDKTVGHPWREGWVLSVNGSLFREIVFPDGTFNLRISAQGVLSNAEWPRLQIILDDRILGEIILDSADWKDFSFSLGPVQKGKRRLALKFVNHEFDFLKRTFRAAIVRELQIRDS